jgi:glycolate oxidase FAD binding subunit
VTRITPKDEAEISAAVREAAATGAGIEIVGHGTKRGYGRHVEANIVLDTSLLTGIVKYEPEELVITARAGTPMVEIEAALAGKNQMLGFEPADWGPLFGAEPGRATLGGVIGANACGSRRVKAGAVRDHIIGCRFVNGEGQAIKAGGNVIKNVTGFDVSRLMCGAFGTLGVLTEVTFRVVPAPARVAAVMISCGAKEGLRLLCEAAQLPLDPTGLAYIPKTSASPAGFAFIRVEGADEPVKQKLAELQKTFADHTTALVEDQAARTLFRELGDGKPLVEIGTDIWRLSVPPASAHDALMASASVDSKFWYTDWAGGVLWLGLPGSADTAAKLRGVTAKFGGHATLMRASDEARRTPDVFEPEVPARAALTRSVKAAFDPKGIFNPGRMFKGI